jgi:hypothetical protein
MIYTYRELLKEFKISNKEYNVPYRIDTTKWFALLENIDMVVDGPFKLEQRLYEEEKGDGFLSSIGSGNQRIWDIQFFNKYHQLRGYAMKDLRSIQLGLNDDLIYYVKQESKKRGVVNVNN